MFGDWLSGLGSSISSGLTSAGNWFGDLFKSAPSSTQETYALNDPGGLQDFGAAPVAYSPTPAPTSDSSWFSNLMGGLGNIVSQGRGFGGVLDTLGKAGQLGATGLGVYGTIKNMQQGAEDQKVAKEMRSAVRQYAEPAAARGNTLAEAGASALMGADLPPALQAQVDQYKAALLARLRDQYARSGVDVSTMMPQAEQYANQQAMAFAAQLASNLYNQGGQGVNTGINAFGNLAATAQGQSNQAQASANNAASNIFKILGQS